MKSKSRTLGYGFVTLVILVALLDTYGWIPAELARFIATLVVVISGLFFMLMAGLAAVWAYQKWFVRAPVAGSKYIKARIPLLNNGVIAGSH